MWSKTRSVLIVLCVFVTSGLFISYFTILQGTKNEIKLVTTRNSAVKYTHKEQKKYFVFKKVNYSVLATTRASKLLRGYRQGGLYKQRLPQAIGIGVKKCGTTALIRFLSLHPDIVIPSQPELHFFDAQYHRGLDYYRSHMPYTAEHEMTIEKSPRYFVLPEVPERVKRMNSTTKIFLVVCDPIIRAYSDFNFELHRNTEHLKVNRTSPVPRTFDEFISALLPEISRIKSARSSTYDDFVLRSWSPEAYHLTLLHTGIYSIYLRNWLKYFPFEQIHVINGDELLKDPVSVLERAQKFLGVDVKVDGNDLYFDEGKGYFCIKPRMGIQTIQCLSPSKGTTRNKSVHEMMSEDTLSSLRDFYGQYNEELFQILGQKFMWN